MGSGIVQRAVENLSSFVCSRSCVFNVLGGTPAFLDEIC